MLRNVLSVVALASGLMTGGCGVDDADALASLPEDAERSSTEQAVSCNPFSATLPDGTTASCLACNVSPPCAATQFNGRQARCFSPDQWCSRSYVRPGTLNRVGAAYTFRASDDWRWTSWRCTYLITC